MDKPFSLLTTSICWFNPSPIGHHDVVDCGLVVPVPNGVQSFSLSALAIMHQPNTLRNCSVTSPSLSRLPSLLDDHASSLAILPDAVSFG